MEIGQGAMKKVCHFTYNKSLKVAHCVRWTASNSAFASQIVRAVSSRPLALRYTSNEI
jgi:hypothetical protein